MLKNAFDDHAMQCCFVLMRTHPPLVYAMIDVFPSRMCICMTQTPKTPKTPKTSNHKLEKRGISDPESRMKAYLRGRWCWNAEVVRSVETVGSVKTVRKSEHQICIEADECRTVPQSRRCDTGFTAAML